MARWIHCWKRGTWRTEYAQFTVATITKQGDRFHWQARMPFGPEATGEAASLRDAKVAAESHLEGEPCER